jgi:hypothetical protein
MWVMGSPEPIEPELDQNQKSFLKRTILLVLLFCLLIRANSLTEFIFEPYIVLKYGSTNFALLEFVLLISNIGAILLNLVLIKYSLWFALHRPQIMILMGIIAIGNWIALIMGPFPLIIVYSAIGQFDATVLNFCFLALLVDCTPIKNQNLIFQLYAVVLTVSSIVANSVGIELNASIGPITLFIIVIIIISLMLPLILNIKATHFKEIIFPTSLPNQTSSGNLTESDSVGIDL